MSSSITAKSNGHDVKVFLLGEAVEIENLHYQIFDTAAQVEAFYKAGGDILACGTCLRSRNMDGSEVCPLSTMMDCLKLVEWADKTLTF